MPASPRSPAHSPPIETPRRLLPRLPWPQHKRVETPERDSTTIAPFRVSTRLCPIDIATRRTRNVMGSILRPTRSHDHHESPSRTLADATVKRKFCHGVLSSLSKELPRFSASPRARPTFDPEHFTVPQTHSRRRAPLVLVIATHTTEPQAPTHARHCIHLL